VSLLTMFLAGTLLLWSYWRFVSLRVMSNPRGVWIGLNDGELTIERHTGPVDEALDYQVFYSTTGGNVFPGFSRGSVVRSTATAVSHGTYWSFPGWLALTPSMLLPLWWVWSVTRGVDPAVCPVCGYDLRGTPSPGCDSGGGSGTPSKTCPECGAASSLSAQETNLA
jgi:hypothetical protein